MKKLIITFVSLFIFSLTNLYAQGEIKLNQLGFFPDSPKVAIVPGGVDGHFQVKDASTDDMVFESELNEPIYWEFSDETVAIADFSDLTEPGRYKVVHETAGSSYDFEIREDIFRELSKASIKAFYFNRASTELLERTGTPFLPWLHCYCSNS